MTGTIEVIYVHQYVTYVRYLYATVQTNLSFEPAMKRNSTLS